MGEKLYTLKASESLTPGVPAQGVIGKDIQEPWKEQIGMSCLSCLLSVNTDAIRRACGDTAC